MDDLISLNEAAALIGKNLRTIQRHIKKGKLTRHEKDGKSFVSRKELEQKFDKFPKRNKEKPKSQKVAVESQTQETKSKPQGFNYEGKWIDEVQKHAETREELGQWKGRAEAYQNFAARLLGNGTNKKDDIVSPVKNYLLYIIIGVLIIFLLFLIVFLRVSLF